MARLSPRCPRCRRAALPPEEAYPERYLLTATALAGAQAACQACGATFALGEEPEWVRYE